MKVSQLKENIRNIVRKKLDEANALVTTKTGTKPVDYKNTTELTKLKSDPNVSSIETTAGQKLKEAGEYTMDRIWKMNRNELIDFLGLTREEAINWSDRQLQGAALEMADDKPADEEIVDEADYIDDDDVIHEDVEDIDDKDPTFKDYDSIYETEISGEFEANVGSGHLGISVKPHSMDQRLIVMSQDNGQKVVVSVEDVYELINTLKGLA